MKKYKIFCQFSDRPYIEMNGGDTINEIRFYRLLSQFADVYYNDVKFDISSEYAGSKDSVELNEPSRDYDLYYVRGNNELFKSLPHPKALFAYPFDLETFLCADYLFVFSQNWKDHLLNYHQNTDSYDKVNYFYQDKFEMNNYGNIIYIPQTINSSFSDSKNSYQIEGWEYKTCNAVNFGFYGRLSHEVFPTMAFNAIETSFDLNDSCEPLITLAGRFREKPISGRKNLLYLGEVPMQDMPSLIHATTCLLGNESKLNHLAGNQKSLEAIACGKLMLCQKLDTYVSHFGDSYECFYENEDEAYSKISSIINDPDFVSEQITKIKSRREFFSETNIKKLLIDQFNQFNLFCT